MFLYLQTRTLFSIFISSKNTPVEILFKFFMNQNKFHIEIILYITSDGVKCIEETINEEFPDAFFQRGEVHLVRNLKQYTTK